MVALFWTVSVLNNYALGFRISMPLHIIFRSMGLFVSMAISWGFFGKSFSRAQVFGVVLVSVGVVAATYSSSAPTDDRNASDATSPFIEWLLGLSILFVALVLSCFLGQFQQVTYTKFGPAWQEALFYTHFLGMPAFLLFYGDLKHQFHEYNNSPLISFQDALAPIRSYLPQNMWQMTSLSPWNGVKIPVMWLYLALNVMTQYVCISGVHRLSSVASAVTLNLILSVRKFVSLVVSIVLFDSEFTAGHWFGTAAVFLGTAIYTKSSNSSSKPKKS
ncbi:hypothetical protein PhCBS80983_g01707 [Powellomyces hirtus]|uniref:Sugar phosphate transporter domain-containing protein n=1 Tax=Powellomyces hirtus TaxID=109895 RepID=A0A507E9Z1_9FUNG|nr:hypothetical protein PhCBS80983_g01707 [Powellomyces hirtus]